MVFIIVGPISLFLVYIMLLDYVYYRKNQNILTDNLNPCYDFKKPGGRE